MVNGSVIVGFRENGVVALSVENGQKKWHFRDAKWVGQLISTSVGLLAVGKGLWMLNPEDGRLIWKADASSILGGAAVYEQRAFLKNQEGDLLCFNIEKGQVIWRMRENGITLGDTPLLLIDKTLYVPSVNSLWALELPRRT